MKSVLPLDAQITFVYVSNLARSTHFYETILGFPLALDQGSCRIFRVAGEKSYLGICERNVESQARVGLIFTLVTPDVDAWYERITEHGVTCEHEPRINDSYGIYHFFVRDPDGHLLEVQRFLQDAWDESGH